MEWSWWIVSAYRLGEASVGTVPNKLARPSTKKAVFQILCCRGRIEIFLCISFQVVCLSEWKQTRRWFFWPRCRDMCFQRPKWGCIKPALLRWIMKQLFAWLAVAYGWWIVTCCKWLVESDIVIPMLSYLSVESRYRVGWWHACLYGMFDAESN